MKISFYFRFLSILIVQLLSAFIVSCALLLNKMYLRADQSDWPEQRRPGTSRLSLRIDFGQFPSPHTLRPRARDPCRDPSFCRASTSEQQRARTRATANISRQTDTSSTSTESNLPAQPLFLEERQKVKIEWTGAFQAIVTVHDIDITQP